MPAMTTVETTRPPVIRSPSEWPQTPAAAPAVGTSACLPVPLSFVRLLATDAKLRSELEAAPAETLALHGIHIAPEAVPAEVLLPDRQELESLVTTYTTDEDRATVVRFGGFLGGCPD